MMIRWLIMMTISCMLWSGCDQVQGLMPAKKKKQTVSRKTVQRIEDAQLAKLLLKPQRQKLDVSRDPFKPLITQIVKDEKPDLLHQTVYAENFELLGTTRIGDEYLALLKTESRKGMFRVNDKILNFTVQDIQHNSVVLKNGIKTITIKRGEIK